MNADLRPVPSRSPYVSQGLASCCICLDTAVQLVQLGAHQSLGNNSGRAWGVDSGDHSISGDCCVAS